MIESKNIPHATQNTPFFSQFFSQLESCNIDRPGASKIRKKVSRSKHLTEAELIELVNDSDSNGFEVDDTDTSENQSGVETVAEEEAGVNKITSEEENVTEAQLV